MTMEAKHRHLILERMEASVTWWLDDALCLLFGYVPGANAESLALEGNDILVRAGLSARKDIVSGKLISVNEREKPDGVTDYLLSRDDFIQWAKTEFPEDGRQLYEIWAEYKKGRPTLGRTSKQEENRKEWQEDLDDLYVQKFRTTGRVPTHVSLCRELANICSGTEGTIRRYTTSRDKAWCLGKIAETKNPG